MHSCTISMVYAYIGGKVGGGGAYLWVLALQWFFMRWKTSSELEVYTSSFLKKSNFCFRVALHTTFQNSLLHFLYWDLARWSRSVGLLALFQ